MGFWSSELGELSGKAEDAFTRIFKTIPDNTMAVAKIERFSNVEKGSNQYYEKGSNQYYEIDWLLSDGEFRGQHVFQKIHAFDPEPKKRHRALNMMKLLFTMFHVKPKSDGAPTDDDLRVFSGKYAGIKIQEWSMEKKDGSGIMEGNHVSEVHPAQGFKCETGVKLEVVHNIQHGVDSALTRNPRGAMDVLDGDIPF